MRKQRFIARWLKRIRGQTNCEVQSALEFVGLPRRKSLFQTNACAGKSLRSHFIFLAAVWVILLISSLTLLSFAVTPFLQVLQSESEDSLSWAGYAVVSDKFLNQPVVVGINASWVVPKVNPSSDDAYSAAWIGIGGHSDKTLIQCGTEHDSINGQEVYYAWFELIPENSITISNIAVQPDDTIKASISLINSDTNEWRMELNNTSQGKAWSQNFIYNASRLSAEWIVERPTLQNNVATLTDFGNITFTDASATLGDTNGKIANFPYYILTMEQALETQLATTSSLTQDGSSFTVAFGNA